MAIASSQTIIDSVVEFTVNRELRALAESLIQTSLQLTSAKKVVIFTVLGSVDDLKLTIEACCEDSVEDGEPLKHLADAAYSCIHKTTLLRDTQSDIPVETIPIYDDEKMSHILVVESASLEENDIHLIKGLAKIFENFLHIITESERDTLTGLLNRKMFHDNMNTVLKLCKKTSTEEDSINIERRKNQDIKDYWLAILDIDHFKRINDTYGHVYGDEVIITVTQLMHDCFRKGDLLFRYGGEEFVVIISAESQSQAIISFDRFRKQVESHDFNRAGQITVSLGMVKMASNENPTEIIGKADRALYYSKENGRNKLSIYEELIANKKLNDVSFQDDIELF